MSNIFSAKEPALGYYYQIIRGLVLLLSENRMDNPVLSFECLDDITIEDGSEVEVYQTKLHIRKMQLTNRSTDFWKTIRVWSEGIKNGSLNPDKTIFTLITTASISNESFLSYFNSENEDDRNTILIEMEKIATEIDNEANRKGYEAFSALTEEQKKLFIKNIKIVDSGVSIEDTLDELKRIIKYTAPSTYLTQYIDSIMGWWFSNSVKMLINIGPATIAWDSLKAQMDVLRDQLRADALPEEFFEAVEVSDEELNLCESNRYVKQLSLIDATKREKKVAISDYKRAYGQRSKWLRDGRVSQKEYDIFDSNLYDNWNSRFGLLQDEVEGLTEAEKTDAGHTFYREFYVNPKYNMPSFKNKGSYITKGSYQMLADNAKVGWHPDYKVLLEEDETVE